MMKRTRVMQWLGNFTLSEAVDGYKKGMFTEAELVSRAIASAADLEAVEILAIIPSTFHAQIREAVLTSEATSPNDIAWVGGEMSAGTAAELSKLSLEGESRLRRYFREQKGNEGPNNTLGGTA